MRNLKFQIEKFLLQPQLTAHSTLIFLLETIYNRLKFLLKIPFFHLNSASGSLDYIFKLYFEKKNTYFEREMFNL